MAGSVGRDGQEGGPNPQVDVGSVRRRGVGEWDGVLFTKGV